VAGHPVEDGNGRRQIPVYKLWLGILITALVAGAANWFTFTMTASVERARMSEQIRRNAEDIGDLTQLVRDQASSHSEFLARLATLTARLDAIFEREREGGKDR